MWVSTPDSWLKNFFFFLQDELPCWVNHGGCTFLDITHFFFLPQLVYWSSIFVAPHVHDCPEKLQEGAQTDSKCLVTPRSSWNPGAFSVSQNFMGVVCWNSKQILWFFFWDSVFYRLGWPWTRDYSAFFPNIGITGTCCHIQLCWLL